MGRAVLDGGVLVADEGDGLRGWGWGGDGGCGAWACERVCVVQRLCDPACAERFADHVVARTLTRKLPLHVPHSGEAVCRKPVECLARAEAVNSLLVHLVRACHDRVAVTLARRRHARRCRTEHHHGTQRKGHLVCEKNCLTDGVVRCG